MRTPVTLIGLGGIHIRGLAGDPHPYGSGTDQRVAGSANAVVLNVPKDELPEDRESRFLPFAFRTGGYAVLLVLIEGV